MYKISQNTEYFRFFTQSTVFVKYKTDGVYSAKYRKINSAIYRLYLNYSVKYSHFFPHFTVSHEIIPSNTDSVVNSAKYRIPQNTISRVQNVKKRLVVGSCCLFMVYNASSYIVL